jgi:Flp pilus assembly protein TadD
LNVEEFLFNFQPSIFIVNCTITEKKMGKASRRKKHVEVPERAEPLAPLPQATPFESIDWIFVSALVTVVLLVYGQTLCPTIFTSGAGENVAAVALLGVPHPPGFPLFCLLGKIFTLLIPMGNMAFRVNLFSAVCGAAAAGMLYTFLKTFLGNQWRFAAAASALLFAFSLTFWSQAVIAEVYTLNALCLATTFYLLVRWEQGAPLWPAGLTAALGLTVHPLQLFFLPGWFFFILRSPRRRTIKFEDVSRSTVAFLGGFALEFYPLLRSKADPALDWGNPSTLRNLIAYLTAAQYRERMFSLPLSHVLQNAADGGILLFRQFTPWLVLLPIAGATLVFFRNRRIFFVTIVPVILTYIYAINYNIPWEIYVYYIPIVFVAAIWTAWLFSSLPTKWDKFSTIFPALAVVPLLLNYYPNDRAHNRIALDYGIDLLRTAPEDSTLILPQTDAAFSVLYLTSVENQRKDLSVWVHTDKNGVNTLRDGVKPDVPAVPLDQFLAGKRNVFLSQRVTEETVSGFNQVPNGVLYRLVPKKDLPNQSPYDFSSYLLEKYADHLPSFYMDDRDRAVLGFYYLSRGDNLIKEKDNGAAMQQYLLAEKIGKDLPEIRSQLGLRFADLGNKTAAIAQLRESIRLMENAEDYNRLGRLLVETNRLDDAKAAFERAIRLNPNLAIAHSNLGAILGVKGDMYGALEELEKSIQLDPQSARAHNNLALAYLKLGKKNEAISHWKTSLTIDPDQQDVRDNLAKLNVQ